MDEINGNFVITDYCQRMETWAVFGSRTGLDVSAVMRTASLYASTVLVPVCGKAVQKLGTFGFEPDGLMLRLGKFRFAALRNLERAVVVGWLPEQHGAEVEVSAACAASSALQRFLPGTMFSLEVVLDIAAGAEHEFQIELSSSFQPSSLPGGSADTRHVGCLIQSVEFT